MGRNNRKYVLIITITALFIACAVITKAYLSLNIVIFGATGMRIGLTGVFSTIPAMLFGPIWGGIAGGIIDVLGYLLNPTGPYLLPMTITATLAGVLKGLLWMVLLKVDSKKFKNVAIVFFILVGIFGIFNHISSNVDGLSKGFLARSTNVASVEDVTKKLESNELSVSSKVMASLAKYAKPEKFTAQLSGFVNFMTIGLEIASALGLAFIGIDSLIKRKTKNENTKFLEILMMVSISGLIITTLNTFILKIYIPQYNSRLFVILWAPRLIEEILISLIQAYILSLLFKHIARISRSLL